MSSRSLLACLLLTLLGSCAFLAPAEPEVSETFEGGVSELEVQALAMQMADDYIAELSATTYLVLEDDSVDSRARALALSFLRNGVGAALDIASGPNPDVAVLDLLVLASLKTWALEKQWIPAGIDPERGRLAGDRLARAEQTLWAMADDLLTDDQESELRALIQKWIDEHPDQIVVSFVRFEDFTDERELSTVGARERASGLLSEVGNAISAVEHARLFGERALWFASRYPYVLGQQVELTAYRMVDQPEIAELRETLLSVGALAAEITDRMSGLNVTVSGFLEGFHEERAETLRQVERGLGRQIASGLDDLRNEIEQLRVTTVGEVFRRLRTEADAALAGLEERSGQLGAVLSEAEATAAVAAEASRSLHDALATADRLAERFDRAPGDPRPPLRIEDLRTTAAEAHLAAEHLDTSLERVDRWFEEDRLDAAGLLDAVFWRAALLLAILLVGLFVLRLLPRRIVGPSGKQD